MSVLLIAPFGFREILITLSKLAVQDYARQLEIVLILPLGRQPEPLPADLSTFHGYQVIEVESLNCTGKGYAAGARAARAEIVVIGEDHSYPSQGWARGLIEAHREGWAAVGPRVRNANPKTVISWASFLINFAGASGAALGHATAVAALPSHQTSYKKSVLLAFGEELPSLLAMEAMLCRRLKESGHQLFQTVQAEVRHINVEGWSTFLREQEPGARQFAALRGGHWPLWRRLVYAALWPLIWLLRCRRTLGHLDQVPPELKRWVSVWAVLGLAVAAVSEAVGYLVGAGRADQRRFPMEFRRRAEAPSLEPE